MRSREARLGRTIAVAFDHGDDFYTALHDACRDNGVQSGYVPVFVAGFATADLVGVCQRLETDDLDVELAACAVALTANSLYGSS
jgi:predicted DNA-binding protein with PD1-like motif